MTTVTIEFHFSDTRVIDVPEPDDFDEEQIIDYAENVAYDHVVEELKRDPNQYFTVTEVDDE